MQSLFRQSIFRFSTPLPKPKINFSPVLLSEKSKRRSRNHSIPKTFNSPSKETKFNQPSNLTLDAVIKPAKEDISLPQKLYLYFQLSKPRLSTLVLLTALGGYAMSPTTCSTSPSLLFSLMSGTFLLAMSANTFNQLLEIPFDRRMQRTRSRPLPSGQVTAKEAMAVGCLSLVGGMSLLTAGVNPVTCTLGWLTVVLYAGVYTPMKRVWPQHTHIGAVVGALPPLMGWVSTLPSLDMIDWASVWTLPLLLYAWQFPHFNALSYTLRNQYHSAGYVMQSVVNPLKNARQALYGSLCCTLLGPYLIYADVCYPGLIAPWLLVNGVMDYYSLQFWKSMKGDDQKFKEKSAKDLFYASLFHLPALMVLLLFYKRHWHDKKDNKTIEND